MILKKINKTALVTGAAKRVGKSIAIALAADGWNIALHHNSSEISETANECQKLGAKICTIRADLNNFDELQKILPTANSELGEISLLINNASIFEKCSFTETEQEMFDRHLSINFKAPFFLSQAFAAQTKDGQIINISDTNVTRNNSTYFAYLLSKKSLSNLTKMLAIELAPNVRVNEVCPCTISEFSENVDPEYTRKRAKELPMQEITNIAQVLDAVGFLANSKLTGQSIFPDGGEQLL